MASHGPFRPNLAGSAQSAYRVLSTYAMLIQAKQDARAPETLQVCSHSEDYTPQMRQLKARLWRHALRALDDGVRVTELLLSFIDAVEKRNEGDFRNAK